MAGWAAEPNWGTFTFTCLEITDVNRGAGLAVVMETPGGKTYLYDTGNGYPSGSGWAGDYNSGRDTILPYLKAKGIRALDGVLISHAHYDHFGGLLWLTDNFPVGKLFDSGYRFQGESPANYVIELADYEKLRGRFQNKPGAYLEAHSRDRLELDERLEVEVIAPPKEFFAEAQPSRRPAKDPPAHYLVNANSLGIRIRHGNIVFLLPGDIQREDQIQSLLPSVTPDQLRCHVLVAPGHGIHSTPEFALAARPEVTIASVIARYGKNSPAPKVFGEVGSKVFITGLHGRITIVSDGKSYRTEVERPEGK
jgi:competence protein ComEC